MVRLVPVYVPSVTSNVALTPCGVIRRPRTTGAAEPPPPANEVVFKPKLPISELSVVTAVTVGAMLKVTRVFPDTTTSFCLIVSVSTVLVTLKSFPNV